MPILRIQRAFLAWLDEAQPLLSRQVVVQRRTKQAIEFAFDVCAPSLHGWLNGWEITVAVTIGGECLDLIYDDYALPTPAEGGFVCCGCEPEAQVVFPTREALWRDHLFEPFGAWINGSLGPAAGLAILRMPGGSTAAKLMPLETNERGWDELLPLTPSPLLPAPRRRANRRGEMVGALV